MVQISAVGRAATLGLGIVAVAACSASQEEDETQADSAYSVANMPTEMNRRIATCFTVDWSAYAFSEASDPTYWTNEVVHLPQKLASTGLHNLGDLLFWYSEGEARLEKVEAELAKTADEQHLQDFQRVALATCVTSHLLTYASDWLVKFVGPTLAAERYEGVCTEYSSINKRFLRSLGVSAGVCRSAPSSNGPTDTPGTG